MEYKYRKSFALPNGKRKNIRSNDKADFERKCAEVRRMLDGGVDVSDDTKVVDLFQQWFDTKRPYLRQSSIEAEKHIINKHLLPEWFACKKVRDVKPAHITTLMCEASGLAKSTQSKMLIILRSAFTYAVDNGIILKSPVLSSHKARGASKEEVKPLSIQQSKALLDATRGTRAYVPVALMLGCGLRRGEVCGLRWSDVDIENGLLHVRNTIDLTPGKEQFSWYVRPMGNTIPIVHGRICGSSYSAGRSHPLRSMRSTRILKGPWTSTAILISFVIPASPGGWSPGWA